LVTLISGARISWRKKGFQNVLSPFFVFGAFQRSIIFGRQSVLERRVGAMLRIAYFALRDPSYKTWTENWVTR
jgi:hypothetical protein